MNADLRVRSATAIWARPMFLRRVLSPPFPELLCTAEWADAEKMIPLTRGIDLQWFTGKEGRNTVERKHLLDPLT